MRIAIAVFLGVASIPMASATDLEQALMPFASYAYGQSKKIVHDTRMTAFRGTNDQAVRLQNERTLLTFVRSDATVSARREACLWLRVLGTEVSMAVLGELTAQGEFADVAQCSLDAIRNRMPAATVTSSPLARFKQEALESSHPIDLLTQSLVGDDELRARLTFQLIAEGVAVREAAAWLGENTQRLSAARQIAAMNVLADLNAKEKTPVIIALSRNGSGAAKVEAIRNLGVLGRREDIPYLQQLWLGADKASADAAGNALLVMPENVVREAILGCLHGTDNRVQSSAIEVVSARGAAFASDALFRIADNGANPNQAPARRAIGKVAPPEVFPRVLRAFAESTHKAMAWDQQVVWDLARRQPDYDQAIAMIKSVAASTSPASAELLVAMAAKLSQLKPKISLAEVKATKTAAPRKSAAKITAPPPPAPVAAALAKNILLPGSYRHIVPKRFEVVTYLNCGPSNKAESGGVSIECANGKPWKAEDGTDPALSLHFANAALEYRISGLDAKSDYILGLTWWDSDLRGRWQSVAINDQEVLPSTAAIGFEEASDKSLQKHKYQAKPTPIRIQFVLLPEHIKEGRCLVRIGTANGKNAVNSEIWIAKRAQPKAAKQILLVSGQDYPGHHWRKTGSVMADLIAQDERMEVTICETPGAVGLRHLDFYDVVFVHFKNYQEDIPATQAMKDKLAAYVRGGGGMCLSHFACGAFMEWPEFVTLSGRIWNGEGHDKRGPFKVEVVDQGHAVTKDLGASFDTDDELYFCLKGEPQIHVLCNAFSRARKASFPQAFVYEPGRGRVFLSTLGHDVRAYEPDAVKRLYRQGTAWAASLK